MTVAAPSLRRIANFLASFHLENAIRESGLSPGIATSQHGKSHRDPMCRRSAHGSDKWSPAEVVDGSDPYSPLMRTQYNPCKISFMRSFDHGSNTARGAHSGPEEVVVLRRFQGCSSCPKGYKNLIQNKSSADNGDLYKIPLGIEECTNNACKVYEPPKVKSRYKVRAAQRLPRQCPLKQEIIKACPQKQVDKESQPQCHFSAPTQGVVYGLHAPLGTPAPQLAALFRVPR